MVNFNFMYPSQGRWPVDGLLWLDSVFDNQTISILRNFNVESLAKPVFTGRARYSFNPHRIVQGETPEFRAAMTKIYTHLSSFGTLEYLINKSLEGTALKVDNVWFRGMEDVKTLFTGGHLGINEDSVGFDLGIHEDHRNILGVFMVYLDSEEGDCGTEFYEFGNFQNSYRLPFKTNTGFFLFGNQHSAHSARNNENTIRRTLNFVWSI